MPSAVACFKAISKPFRASATSDGASAYHPLDEPNRAALERGTARIRVAPQAFVERAVVKLMFTAQE